MNEKPEVNLLNNKICCFNKLVKSTRKVVFKNVFN